MNNTTSARPSPANAQFWRRSRYVVPFVIALHACRPTTEPPLDTPVNSDTSGTETDRTATIVNHDYGPVDGGQP
jgi:hypothetical protein